MLIKNSNQKNWNTFTVRFDEDMVEKLNYLQEKKFLNKTAIIRLAIAEMYDREIKGVINND